MSKVLCIYHANCADGLGASWAVHRALGDGVEFVAAKYGDKIAPELECIYYPDLDAWDCSMLQGRDILIVGSYPLATLRAMATEARSVLVLDHHKTAWKDLRGIPHPPSDWKRWQETAQSWWQYGDVDDYRDKIPNLAAIFDTNRSGAGIAWDYLHLRALGRDAAIEAHGERSTIDQLSEVGTNGSESSSHRGERRTELAFKPTARVAPSDGVSVPRPCIIDLIEDRDLWGRGKGPSDESRAFHAVLTSYDITDLPAMFERLDKWFTWEINAGVTPPYGARLIQWERLFDEGRAILRAKDQLVAATVAASRRTMRIAGRVVPVANAPPQLASDAGHLLCQDLIAMRGEAARKPGLFDPGTRPTFSATYHDGADGKRHFSLRSPEGGADVGKIARSVAASLYVHAPYGSDGNYRRDYFVGGGHEHAAGFDAPLGWEGE